MAFTHGKSAYVAIGTAASETVISTYTNDAAPSRKVDKAETTTFGVAASSKTYLAGLNETSVKLGGVWDPTLDSTLTALLGVDGKSIVVGPQGSTTGQVKYSALGFLASYDPGIKIGSAVMWSAEFQVSGVWTTGTF